MDERERRRQRRYREAMRNRAIAAVFLAVLIVGIIFIVKGCRNKKQEQDQQQQQAAETLARQDDQQEPAAKPSAADNELLTLVNPWNPLPSDWEVDLVDLSNGSQIDRRCYDALQEMMDACRDAGYEPLICSAYRTQETQQELFDKKVAAFEAEGKSHGQAVAGGRHGGGRTGHQRASAGSYGGRGGHQQPEPDGGAGKDPHPEVADGQLLALRVHPPLSQRKERCHRHHL